MTQIFKTWITTIFCIGIFLTFIQMIVPNTKLKKYIYSLIGVITIVTLLMPIVEKLSANSIEDITQSVINNLESEAYSIENGNIIQGSTDITNENLKKEFIRKIKDDMKKKLSDYNIYPEMISIILDDSYNIKKVNIKIKAQNVDNNVNTIFKCISQNYSVLDDNITIEEV